MKTSAVRRALVLANLFNLLVAIYFIIISIISLVKLRWFHQLTMFAKVRHIFTTATSYLAFIILLLAAILLIAIFIISTLGLSSRTYTSSNSAGLSQDHALQTTDTYPDQIPSTSQRSDSRSNQRPFVVKDSIEPRVITTTARASSSMLLHLLTSICLVSIIVIWLLNAGELVRDSISTQLDDAFAKYQFANRSNHYSIAIDGMQDVNNCCGSLDYTDFPQRRTTGLSNGHYPGSCCGKNIFGVNARVLCNPEEIIRAKQTTGCVLVLSNYYDLISILVVPVSLVSLFVNITLIALIAISRGHQLIHETKDRFQTHAQKFELRNTG